MGTAVKCSGYRKYVCILVSDTSKSLFLHEAMRHNANTLDKGSVEVCVCEDYKRSNASL